MTRKLNPCIWGHAGGTRVLRDARGIFCGHVCDVCEHWVRSQYRPEIFTDAQYWVDEPIEPIEPEGYYGSEFDS